MKFHRLCVAASRLLEGVNQMTKLSKQCLNCVRPRAACVVSSKVLIVFDADNPYYSFHKTLKKTKIFLIRITDKQSFRGVLCLAQVFSCEFCEISKNAFSHRTRLLAASKQRHIQSPVNQSWS